MHHTFSYRNRFFFFFEIFLFKTRKHFLGAQVKHEAFFLLRLLKIMFPSLGRLRILSSLSFVNSILRNAIYATPQDHICI